MDESTARDLIDRYWRAAEERDFSSVGDLFADDVMIEWPQSGERVRGKEACVRVFTNYPGGSPKLIAVNRVMGAGDMWMSEAELEYPGGQRYITASMFEFKDGKIAHEVDYFAEEMPAPAWRSQWVEVVRS